VNEIQLKLVNEPPNQPLQSDRGGRFAYPGC
jgi:hypothetical protein